MNQTDDKSPFGSIMNFLNVIPRGHEKALKQAFFNAGALFILFLCGAAGWALFYILEPFMKPLIWALLIGSVVHPFKYFLTTKFELWFHDLTVSSTPLFLGFFLLPIHLVDDLSESIGNVLKNYIKILTILGTGVMIAFLVYTYTPYFFVNLMCSVWYINNSVLLFIMDSLSIYTFVLIVIGYITILIFYWNEEKKQLLSAVAYVMWFLIALFSVKIFGILQIPLFLFTMFALSFGFAYEVFMVLSLSCENVSCWNAVKKVFEGNSSFKKKEFKEDCPQETYASEPSASSYTEGIDEGEKIEKEDNKFSSSRKPGLVRSNSEYMNTYDIYTAIGRNLRLQALESIASQKDVNCENRKESSKYIYGVIWACIMMVLWKNFWMLHFLPILIAIYFIKHLGLYFGFWDLLYSQWSTLIESLTPWVRMRELAIFPPPIRGLYKFAAKLHINVLNSIHNSISYFASTLVICGLIFFVFCFSFFIIFQIYAEGIYLLSVGAGVVNTTVVNNPEFLKLLPEGWGNKMESVINDAYIYGREGISRQVHNFLKDVEKGKASEFEKHALELWDRVYQAWFVGSLERNSYVGPKVTTNAVISSWEKLVGVFHKMPDLFNVTLMTDFAKENVGTLVSLLESLWNLLKGNFSLIFQFFFASLTLLLGGGTVVLNFLISTIVFFTALFYLLSSSGAVYKPVELLSNFSPTNGSKLGTAFEAAVNGVFKASFKMALFYGLWTWLIHNIFQVRIVYIPSVLAALLGAVPFLGTYWASIPAVLDLWLAQDKGFQAIIIFVFQFLPISFVDTAIYREIKGGHPYMTGLAIAGGVFCMGIQGAIFGPVLLCCLLVALDMSSSLMKESPSDPSLAALSMRHLRRDSKNEKTDGAKHNYT